PDRLSIPAGFRRSWGRANIGGILFFCSWTDLQTRSRLRCTLTATAQGTEALFAIRLLYYQNMSIKTSVSLGLFVAAILSGADPVGSVSSMGPVDVSGTTLSASTVTSWPLVSGDEVTTKASGAVIFLTGKGRVTMQGNSRVRIERS